METTILIMSCGSLAAQNVIEALFGRRHNLRLVGTNSVANANVFDFDSVYITPETNASAFESRFRYVVEKEKPAIVVPTRDEDVAWLSQIEHRTLVEAVGGSALCGEPTCAESFLDKALSYKRACKAGLPFARSIAIDGRPADEIVAELDLPLVVKPRKGFASRGVSLLWKTQQLDHVPTDGSMLAQEYLGASPDLKSMHKDIGTAGFPLFRSFEAEKFSLQVILGNQTSSKVCATRHRMRNGMSTHVSLASIPELQTIGQRFADAYRKWGWIGPLNIQCQRNKEGDFRAFELNGRFTGATAARVLIGFDEVGLAFDSVAGLRLPNTITDSRQHAVTRTLYSARTPEPAVKHLQTEGEWHA